MISSIFSSFGILDVFSLLIIFTAINVTRFYYRYFTRPNPLPGPFPLPFLGNVLQQIGHEFNDWIMLMHKKYGDMFEINFAGERIIIVSRADLIENMVSSSTKTKYPFRVNITEGFAEYGVTESGIVTNNDFKSWKFNRQFFTQAMMNSEFYQQAIDWSIESCEQMVTYWINLGENRELNLTKWMRRFTNDIIFRIATGTKNHSVFSYYNSLILENDKLNENEKVKIKESEDFIQSIDKYNDGVIYFFIFNKFIRHYVPFVRGKVNYYLKNKDYLFGRLYSIIKQRRIEIENTPLNQPLRHDILTSNIIANTPRDINAAKHDDDDFSRPMNDREIFGCMLDAMFGGTDTTANLFCFIIYFIEHYPEVKNRLIQEFEEVLGKDLTKPIVFKDLNELQYCDAVIKEVYRHIPITFVTSRINAENDNVGGYIWPKGTSFQMHFAGIMKHKECWTDPEKFDPDRFYKVEESDRYLLEKQHAKSSFHMWGGGIRICPGRKLAIIEIKCLLTLIYRKYDIELDMNEPLKYKANFLTLSKELWFKVKPKKF